MLSEKFQRNGLLLILVRGSSLPDCFIKWLQVKSNCFKCCMPQGSILGPFLSLNYIGDSHVWLNYSEERYFAFDTNLNFINKQVNYDLQNFGNWLKNRFKM